MSLLDDDCPPPLEDMASEVAQIKRKREPILRRVTTAQQQEKESIKPAISTTTTTTTTTIASNELLDQNLKAESQPFLIQTPNTNTTNMTNKETTSSTSNNESKSSAEMFAGFKGGFFNQPASSKQNESKQQTQRVAVTKPTPPSADIGQNDMISLPNHIQHVLSVRLTQYIFDPMWSCGACCLSEEVKEGDVIDRQSDIPFIKPNGSANSSLRFEEVQEAVKGISGLDLTSPDFLTKLQSEPELMKGLINPRISAAMSDIQRNPRAAIKKYQQDTEIVNFILRFMRLMGSHLDDKGTGAEEEEKRKKSTAASNQQSQQSQQRSIDPVQVQRWMSDPIIRNVLNDPNTSEMLSKIQQDQKVFGKYAADPRIAVLVRAGILEVPAEFKLP